MAHMALGYGHQVRRIAKAAGRSGASPLLDLEPIERRLARMAEGGGCPKSSTMGRSTRRVTVLADDEAIFDGLAESRPRPPPLISQAMTSTLIASPRAARPRPCGASLDRGVTLVARPGNARARHRQW